MDSETKILLAEDDEVSRRMCEKILRISGMSVDTAENGRIALEKFLKGDYSILITDWMMPEMDGTQLVQEIRSLPVRPFTYIIMLTAKSQTGDVVRGLEAGADDYLTKPFEKEELLARVRAGIRIRNLNHRLETANQELEEVNKDLALINQAIRKDLAAARRTQESLLPKVFPEVPGIEFAARLIPCAYVAGDIYNIFRLDETHIGFYQVDVSGHGVPAALFSASLSQLLTHDLHQHGLLKVPVSDPPYYRINPPARVVELLNEDNMFEKHGHYLTMLYAILNTEVGTVSFSRAGHNMPLIVHTDGSSEYIREGGGCPIGLTIPREPEEQETIQLMPGDSFVIYSDGINEAGIKSGRGEEYGIERARDILTSKCIDPLVEAFDALIVNVEAFMSEAIGHKAGVFDDDVSIMGVRWKPAG